MIVGELAGQFLACRVDQPIAGNLVEPGPKVATHEAPRQAAPDSFPDYLVHIFQVGAAHPAGEKGKQEPRMPAVELRAGILS